MTLDRSEPPWTADEVTSLNEYQHTGYVHPFTCPNGSHILVAIKTGFFCPHDGYVQKWAYKFMTDWSWKKMAPSWLQNNHE